MLATMIEEEDQYRELVSFVRIFGRCLLFVSHCNSEPTELRALAPVTEREGHYRRVRSLNRRTVEDSVLVGYSQSSATKFFAFPLSIFCI